MIGVVIWHKNYPMRYFSSTPLKYMCVKKKNIYIVRASLAFAEVREIIP